MSNSIIKNLFRSDKFSDQDVALIWEKFQHVELEKGQHILKEGQICTFVGIVEHGLLLFYTTSDEGEEKICDFALENQWVSQYKSMITQTKSPISIKAIEPTVVHKISYQNLQYLGQKIPQFENVIRQLIDTLLILMMERTNDFQNLKAEERYEKLLAVNPELLQRVPQYYIASFLGIAPQSLSRIRKSFLG